jgi:dGTPase
MSFDLNKMYSPQRTGIANPTNHSEPRTEYQRDFDRIIFSSPFRRLQNKTQVFPLPGSVFVHNRLTHSLEVASVGRSLGTLVGNYIASEFKADLSSESQEFYKYSLYNVVAAACLCHDIGNPAFGHSGEDAIASFFKKNSSDLEDKFSREQWSDLINFEGNANAIRILTQQQSGKSAGGFKLTFTTLATIAKYPCESVGIDENFAHRKKFGFFKSEKDTFCAIAKATSMIKETDSPLVYSRHPYVWLVEAADDICYTIIDLEDSHRLGIISSKECIDILVYLIQCIGLDDVNALTDTVNSIGDKNDKISYLRAKSIHALTITAKENYLLNSTAIFNGTHGHPLFDMITQNCDALKTIKSFSKENIYNHRSVVEIENAGYNVMYQLLEHFIFPILKGENQKTAADKKALKLMPKQFIYEDGSHYQQVLGVLDYVSGMTDNYAADLY